MGDVPPPIENNKVVAVAQNANEDKNASNKASKKVPTRTTRSSKNSKFYELVVQPNVELSMASNVVTNGSDIPIQICLPASEQAKLDNPKKRLCRFPGCERTIKSQGHCQRHGAKVKRCRFLGCKKQAQGTHEGMCKVHWKEVNDPEPPPPVPEFPEPEGESAYDHILPQSIGFRPSFDKNISKSDKEEADKIVDIIASPPFAIMPLVKFLNDGAEKEHGWHRNLERRARGIPEVTNLQSQLENWEKQLALVEILLLSGGTPYASFRNLSHAWGREKGFHLILCNSVCERRGEVDRKRRKDASTAESIAKSKKKARRSQAPPTTVVGYDLAAAKESIAELAKSPKTPKSPPTTMVGYGHAAAKESISELSKTTKSPKTSKALKTPPKSPKTSKTPKTSKALKTPPKSPKTSKALKTPPKSPKISTSPSSKK